MKKKTVKKSSKYVRKNSFKVVFKRALKKALASLVNLKNKFTSLPKKLRYIIYVWVAVFALIIILIIGSNSATNRLNKYKAMEDLFSQAAEKYASKLEIKTDEDAKVRVDYNMLIDNNYISKSAVEDDTCVGFSTVYYDEENSEYVIKPYLNCKHYTTKGYVDAYNEIKLTKED